MKNDDNDDNDDGIRDQNAICVDILAYTIDIRSVLSTPQSTIYLQATGAELV